VIWFGAFAYNPHTGYLYNNFIDAAVNGKTRDWSVIDL